MVLGIRANFTQLLGFLPMSISFTHSPCHIFQNHPRAGYNVGTLRETSMSLSNLPGLPQPSTLSSQSSRPSWTGDLPQRLCRWLPQVFLSQSTIPVPPCELESPCRSWVKTQTFFPLPKGTLDFQLSWRPGTISAQE